MYVIDFAPGSHGHFLEYITNRYIFQIESQKFNLQKSGASHSILNDTLYQNNKIINCGHYTSFNGGNFPPDTKKVIFVKHCKELDFILLVNVYNRCHRDTESGQDLEVDYITKFHYNQLKTDTQDIVSLRRNWFTKFSESHGVLGQGYQSSYIDSTQVINFDYRAFFSITNFLIELRKLANFFNQTLTLDYDFPLLYKNFIDQNQGYNKFLKVNDIINKINSGNDFQFEANWMDQAWINYVLSIVYNLHDGKLHDSTVYPTNTKDIYEILMHHIKMFDIRYPQ